jgi:DNA polymerase III epsilon subunit-like protein
MASVGPALQLVLPLDVRPAAAESSAVEQLPGVVLRRGDLPRPAAYAVVDCETTGTDPERDEIVSIAVVRLDPDGTETDRLTTLVRPSIPIPSGATAVHGIADADVASAGPFSSIAPRLLALLEGAVFTAHNVAFDLPVVRRAFERVGVDYAPEATACTLEAFRLLEPRAENHRLESLCARHGIVLGDAHQALGDVLGAAALLRELLRRGLAPESVRLDRVAYQRARSRGDGRPASEPQVRRVFGLARAAGLVDSDGVVDRAQVVELVREVVGVTDPDALTREQVQDVFEALERLGAARQSQPGDVRPAVAG